MQEGTDRESAVAKHFCGEEHRILWNDTKVIQRTSRTMELVMKEALCIMLTPEDTHFNRDNEYKLPDYWITTLRRLGGEVATKRTPTSA